MDVHRCRFVNYPASAINAVAFSHSTTLSDSPKRPVRLAIGRANGDIEIWNPLNGSWHHEITLQGGKDRSIDGLVWVTPPDEHTPDGKTVFGRSRLFSVGYTSTVTEWDLEKGKAKKHASGQHGDIWCLAAQPLPGPDKSKQPNGARSAPAQTQRLVAGTIDGCLAIYSIEDDDLRLQRVIVKSPKKDKMVCMTFQSRHVVIVGCSDSTIRAYDIRNGSMIRKMTLGADLKGGSKDIIVWSVKCLRNGDIVSGDSTGQVCIWDAKTYTQAQRMQSHNQDVLSLATSADGSVIMSGGMDRKTVIHKQMSSGPNARWSQVWHRRFHNHDVKAMASFEGKGMSVVVSGGPDASPVVLPLKKAGIENHRTLPHLPQKCPVRSASAARLLISWWEREVSIWKLRRPFKDMLESADVDFDKTKNHKLLARVLIKGESNISSATISADGSLLVVGTITDVKAFTLKLPNPDENEDDIRISKVDVHPRVASRGATNIQISPDGSWVCLIQDSSNVHVFRTSRTGPDARPILAPRTTRLRRTRREIAKHSLLGGLGSYDRTITQIGFSPDSKMLAVADLAGYIDTWLLHGTDGSLINGEAHAEDDDASQSSSSSDSSDDENNDVARQGLRWIRNPKGSLLPKLPSAPVILSFSNDVSDSSSAGDNGATSDYTLLTITRLGQLYTFHPQSGHLTPWSKRNPTAKLPAEFHSIRDLAKGVLWQGPRAWIFGVSFLFMLDTSVDMADPQTADEDAKRNESARKRKRNAADSGAGSKTQKGSRAPSHVRMATQKGDEVEWVDVDMEDVDEAGSRSSDDETDDIVNGDELQLMRQTEAPNGEDAVAAPRRKWWHTYKYRPILGIVPLEAGQTDEDDAGLPPLEVALVERPIWEAELPPRYFGDNEWER